MANQKRKTEQSDPCVSEDLAETIRRRLARWYAENFRQLPWRQTTDPYRIWVSEIMLQQTQVKTVIPYYHAFLSRFPDVFALAAADPQELLKAWEGLGYYARARNLHKAARAVAADHDGRVPDTYDAIVALPGIGGYVAAAVLSFAYGLPHAVVDGNVKRVLSRLLAMDQPVNRPASHRIYQASADRLLDRQAPARHNQAMMEIGALVCTPRNPKCGACPLSGMCRAHARQAVSRYPVRDRRKPVPTYDLAIGVIRGNDCLLITRRPADGLLGGLWEFPGGIVNDGEAPEAACRRIIEETSGLAVRAVAPVAEVRHAYSHFKVNAAVFACECAGGETQLSGPAECRWVPSDELARYPFTGVARKILSLLEKGRNE